MDVTFTVMQQFILYHAYSYWLKKECNYFMIVNSTVLYRMMTNLKMLDYFAIMWICTANLKDGLECERFHYEWLDISKKINSLNEPTMVSLFANIKEEIKDE